MYRFLEDKMKTKILLSLIALSFTSVGCYTSFSTREYEEEDFGQIEESIDADSMIVYEDENGNLDTVYTYAENYEEYPQEPVQNLTVVNQYYNDNGCWFGGFYGVSRFYYPSSYYCYDPYWYDPYCYSPYYAPLYVGIYVGGNYYVDHYSGGSYYPSEERYRRQTSHWTSLRNNDSGRRVSRTTGDKSRDAYRGLSVASRGVSSNGLLSKGSNLDRDLEKISTSQNRTQLASLNDGGIRDAGLSYTQTKKVKNSEVQKVSTKSVKQSQSSTRKVVKREAINQSNQKRTAKNSASYKNTNRSRTYREVQNRTSYGKRKNTSTNRNKVYNNGNSKSSVQNSEAKSSSSSKRSSYRSNSSKSNKSSSYYSNRSSSKSSGKSYSGGSSRSSSKSSYSGSSSRSSSRSSYSKPSSGSSSRNSGTRSSSRGGSSRSSSGKRR